MYFQKHSESMERAIGLTKMFILYFFFFCRGIFSLLDQNCHLFSALKRPFFSYLNSFLSVKKDKIE